MAHSQLEQPKRGYIANVWTIPPLVYPFQYNPTQISDSKKLDWGPKYEALPPRDTLTSLSSGVSADLTAFSSGFFGGVGQTLGSATTVLGRVFSSAEMKRFEKEQPRTVNFKFLIDGREKRPGEPDRRRNDDGDIVGDLAVIRSFVYPQFANWLDAASALAQSPAQGLDQAATATNLWFNKPPTMTLVLGGMSIEGFVQDLKITETLFNKDLNPTRAEVDVTLLEKIDSISFILDSIKRLGRSFYYTDYEDIVNVLF